MVTGTMLDPPGGLLMVLVLVLYTGSRFKNHVCPWEGCFAGCVRGSRGVEGDWRVDKAPQDQRFSAQYVHAWGRRAQNLARLLPARTSAVVCCTRPQDVLLGGDTG